MKVSLLFNMILLNIFDRRYTCEMHMNSFFLKNNNYFHNQHIICLEISFRCEQNTCSQCNTCDISHAFVFILKNNYCVCKQNKNRYKIIYISLIKQKYSPLLILEEL